MCRRSILLAASTVFLPLIANAHEVYVLDPAVIARDVAANSPNPLAAIPTHEFEFFFWGFISFVTVSTIFCMSAFHLFERAFAPIFARMKKYAAPAARATLAISLLGCAYNAGLFGPELPFRALVGDFTPTLQILVGIAAICILFGLYTRVAVLPLAFLFGLAILHWGSYMFTYTNYGGEIILGVIFGGGFLALHNEQSLPKSFRRFAHTFEHYSFALLRVAFGISIVFAAVYAKFIHSQLALDTIAKYHLTNYFHFEPLFFVLGAFIIESLIGIFFIFGIALRWTAIFFLFWITLSLLYFGEAVWPHLVLIGLNITIILHGYDRYALEGFFFKRRLLEPVL